VIPFEFDDAGADLAKRAALAHALWDLIGEDYDTPPADDAASRPAAATTPARSAGAQVF